MSATPSAALNATIRADEEKSRATGSATGETSRARTLSNVGSEVDLQMTGTLLPGGVGMNRFDSTNVEDLSSSAAMRSLVDRLEQLLRDSTLRAPMQPKTSSRYVEQLQNFWKPHMARHLPDRNYDELIDLVKPHSSIHEIETLIEQACAARPENRTHLAAMTKSPWLRQKILSCVPRGGRMAGSSTLGNTHGWIKREKLSNTFTDHNWPKVAVNPQTSTAFGTFLPGGDHRHTRLLRCNSDQLPLNHLLHLPPAYTISKDRKQGRFWGTKENGEIDKRFQQLRAAPGPGAYHKTMPRGPHIPIDGGETIVLGANHTCPWKTPLGHHINPTDISVQSVHHSSPQFSFSKTRRGISDTFLGHGQQAGGPVKSDQGCLSPGLIYEHTSSFRPGVPLRRKRTGHRNSNSKPRMKCIPVDPDPEDLNQNGRLVTDEDIEYAGEF